MKKVRLYLLLLLVVFFTGCQTLSDVTGSKDKEPPPPFTPVDPATLDGPARLAVLAISLARLDALAGFPYVRSGPDSHIVVEDQIDPALFERERWVIVENLIPADGLRSLVVLERFVDNSGRIALSAGKILYNAVSPDESEQKVIRENLGEGYQACRSLKDEKLRKQVDDAIRAFQEGNGLVQDGVVGRNTIAALLSNLRIVDIRELTIETVYPSELSMEVFILSAEAVDQDPDRYFHGFDSLAAAKEKAIAPEAFKELLQKEGKAVIFVFFHDRVDPGSAIQIGFTKFKGNPSADKSPGLYNTPGNWPVLVWPIDVSRIDPFGSLYLDVYLDNRVVQTCELR